ncbi:ribonuclease HII [Aureibaculum sp. 2210JD6-5]|uniref:ribonuclease HII n=1 Tax=Aureibaculum sp. 2210JD6-5 TaxID=3103957 RepID=UPI002AAD9CED|nr:ribonuclease HII [Aureibaculum sp. 2210JD6-5]MDY7393968.1 ribonuclease HII [Aureibaculum sp. 2210JD6-5]
MSLQLNFSGFKLEAGTDEAGRGCLSGPVVAAAVILPEKFELPLLNDSKQLSEKQRIELRPFIEKNALTFSVSFVWQGKIDEINILQSSILAMHQAISQLKTEPEFIIIDGNKFKPYKKIQHATIVKGDSKYMSIAAASILAKTYRDEYMEKIHHDFPHYNWKQNKGYPTKQHRLAIEEFGVTEHHRKSFKLLPEQLKLKF